jgi:hypothetical protein
MESVYSAVRTESLNEAVCDPSFKVNLADWSGELCARLRQLYLIKEAQRCYVDCNITIRMLYEMNTKPNTHCVWNSWQ